jgi:hypothetical protein
MRQRRFMVVMFGGWVNEAIGFLPRPDGRKIHAGSASTGDLSFAAGEELHRRALRLAGAAKQPAFEAIETVGGGKEPKSGGFPNHYSRRLRTHFDDVGV